MHRDSICRVQDRICQRSRRVARDRVEGRGACSRDRARARAAHADRVDIIGRVGCHVQRTHARLQVVCTRCDVHVDGIDGNAGPKGRSLTRRRYESQIVNVGAALSAHNDVARTFNGLIGFIRFIVCSQSREVCRNRAFHDILRCSSRESHRAARTHGEREGGDVILSFGRHANIRLLFRGEERQSVHICLG